MFLILHYLVGVPMIQNEMIFEKNISEHVGLRNMNDRVDSFRTWLAFRPEKVIIVVGHSAFFRSLLQLKNNMKMKNCEVCSSLLDKTLDGSLKLNNVETIIQGGTMLLNRDNIASIPL